MSDIVGVLENNCNTLGWTFSYGNRANNNLLESSLDADEIYLLLSPVTRVPSFSEYGGIESTTFSGQFFLVVKSDLDQVYHTQKDVTSTVPFEARVEEDGGTIEENACIPLNGKYEKNIKPLLDVEIVRLYDIINCSQYEISSWSMIDAINALDVNMDGLLVTFSLLLKNG